MVTGSTDKAKMIDFHTHILPGIDDGSDSIQTSIAMLREEKKQGIDTAILTPHFYANENDPERFLEKRTRAWQKLEPYLTDDLPSVFLGAEVQYFEGICSVEEIRQLRIQNTNFLLLEMPFCRWSGRVLDDLFELNERQDTQVVLAHFERYAGFQQKEIWRTIREGGVWLQSNVSFFGTWKTRAKAMKLLSSGEISFVGSDCHNMSSRSPNWHKIPPKAVEILKRSKAYRSLAAQLER